MRFLHWNMHGNSPMNLTICEPGKVCCSQCEKKVPLDSLPFHMICPKCSCGPCLIQAEDVAPVKVAEFQNKPLPNLVIRGWNYAKAVAKWELAGSPERSQEEINAILEICRKCEEFNAEKGACSKCGCNINAQRKALSNKLAMATEHCPLDPPKW